MAFLGFYSSVRLDLPLGPTDVTLGCCLIFLAYGLSRISKRMRPALLALIWCCSIAKRLQRQNRGAAYSRGQSDSRRKTLAR